MRFDRDEARERTVDYLYGELAGEELSAFEAALREDEDLAREVESLKRTLGMARTTLREHGEAPPSRVRGAVLAAARAQAASAKMESAEPAQAPRHAHVAREPARDFWAFLRAPWLFPAFGVCAAIAFVIVRQSANEPRELAAAPSPAQQSSDREAPLSEGAAEAAKGEAPAEAKRAARDEASESVAAAPTVRGGAVRAKEKREAAERTRAVPFPGATSDELASAPARKARATSEQPRASSAGAAPRGEARPRDDAYASGSGGLGAASQARRSVAKRAADVDEGAYAYAEERAEPPASAPSASAPAAPAPSVARTSASPPPKASSAAPAAEAEAERDPAAPANESASTLAKRAAEATRAGRLREARELYRELLRRFPDDSRVPAWRRELERTERALTGGDAAR